MAENRDEQINKAIDEIIAKYDADKNNSIEKSELRTLIQDALKLFGAETDAIEPELTKLFNSLDLNNDGKVTKQELLQTFNSVLK